MYICTKGVSSADVVVRHTSPHFKVIINLHSRGGSAKLSILAYGPEYMQLIALPAGI